MVEQRRLTVFDMCLPYLLELFLLIYLKAQSEIENSKRFNKIIFKGNV
jgi:hypothetical protein